jgi:hypothetical protein
MEQVKVFYSLGSLKGPDLPTVFPPNQFHLLFITYSLYILTYRNINNSTTGVPKSNQKLNIKIYETENLRELACGSEAFVSFRERTYIEWV